MPLKAVDVTASDSETSTTFDIDAPDEVKEEIGEYLVEQILAHNAESKSPVSGYGKYKALSPAYRLEKEESGRAGEPNLDFYGDMNSALDFELTEDGIKVGVFGDQAPKADGHNNLSGLSKLPTRRFLPDIGEGFKRDIDQEIETIIAENAVKASLDEFENADLEYEFSAIESREEFYDLLTSLTGIEEEFLLRGAVRSSPRLLKLIRSKGLAGYLAEDE